MKELVVGIGTRDFNDALGFTWDREAFRRGVGVHEVERALWRYRRSLPEFVWDAAVLEGNPFTYPEVQTLMDGVSVGGHKLSDELQVVRLADSARALVDSVNSGAFKLSKENSDYFQEMIARGEALESGHFRGEGRIDTTPGVYLGHRGRYEPPPTELGGGNLRTIYARGLAAINDWIDDPFEQALAYFLFAALQQFYFDGNKRTARTMMNGHLMINGIDAISVPAARRKDFNSNMVDFFADKDGTAMFGFLASCHPDFAE